MGSRNFKKSGGYLNGVAVTFLGYRWTDDVPSKDGPISWADAPKKIAVPGGKPKDRFHGLQMEITVLPDGAKEPVTQMLFGGGWDDFTVSEDSLTLSNPKGGSADLGEDTGVAKFVTSALQAGFPLEELPEDDSVINYEAFNGKRFYLVQRKNEKMAREGKKRVDKNNKNRSYDYTDLVVDQYLGEAEETPVAAQPAKQAAKPTGATAVKAAAAKTSAPRANGKANGKVATTFDLASASENVILSVLTDNGGSLTKTKMGTKILQALMNDKEHRDDIRKWAMSDDNLSALAEQGTISYDQPSSEVSLPY